MAVTRTGSVTTIQTASQTGSQSVTVPNDAEIMIVKIAGFLDGTNVGEGTYTINSQSLTAVWGATGDVSEIFYKISPSTGSQTFAWDFGSAPLSDEFIEISFYKGINTGDAIGASAYAYLFENIDTANTGEMTASNGDAVVAVALIFSESDPFPASADWTNATELTDTTWAAGVYSGAEAFPSGNVTITATQNGGAAESNFVQLMAVVIKQASAGTTSVSGLMLLGVG